ncbi:MAG TPA: helix-turn-helix transcriptional regulator [Candidatus Limnocylindrales bacterium]|nr:helix-turn-helix transcriptional regulator [Candidatus Limnocylindrales bacterium]
MQATEGTRSRRRVVVDQRELAKAIGQRIRTARIAAQLTQQELAGDRYTKAYISALELGHAKPSMAALDYLAPRLGTTPDRLLTDHAGRWTRVDADLHLAAGRNQEAIDAYLELADRTPDGVVRGELLLGAGEAYARLRDVVQAGPLLAEASSLLAKGGRPADRVRAQYWRSWVHMHLNDPDEARRLLIDLLEHGLEDAEDPDMEVRIRIALASIESWHGSPDRARQYLEEARGGIEGLDIRRRAVLYDVLSVARRNAGDAEGAIRAGLEAITLFRAAHQVDDIAMLENQLAVAFVEIGNLGRAEELAASARAAAEQRGDLINLGHVLDTQAMIHLARGDASGALELAERSLSLETDAGIPGEQTGARITRARALTALGRLDEADAGWEVIAAEARELKSPYRRKVLLSAYAEMLAARGRHAEAYEVMRETL